jgi:transcriptional regulator with PAS, ATPase and Fis domain
MSILMPVHAVAAPPPAFRPDLDPSSFDRIVGQSAALDQAVRGAQRLANADSPLLLHGETGVGKDLFASAIHESGRRRNGPLIALNCGGLPRDLLASELFGYVDGAFTGARRSGMRGKLEAADGGTLFLDEIAEMPLDLQPYLLRVLEGGEVYPLGSTKSRTVRFRLVAACNCDLRSEVSAGRFRIDLFYRISVTALRIPPLRERVEDIPLLVEHFGRDVAARSGLPAKRFPPDVLAVFATHAWPGNLRELRNVVEAMFLMADGDVVGLGALPPELVAAFGRHDAAPVPDTRLARVERDAIGAAIRTLRGNLTHAARELGISKSTLYLKMKKYALEAIVNEVRRGVR